MPAFPFVFPFTFPGAPYTPHSETFGELTYDAEHAADAIGLLLEQFKEMPLIEGYIKSYANRTQEVEDALWQILEASDLDNAEHAQLEGLGLLVGEERRSRVDDDYRAAIRVRILINRCGGTHPEILRILSLFLGIADGARTIRLDEPAPAALRLQVYSLPSLPADLRVIARTIKPAGVNLDGRYETSLSRPYRFGWSGGAVAGVTGAANGDSWSDDPTVGGLMAARI